MLEKMGRKTFKKTAGVLQVCLMAEDWLGGICKVGIISDALDSKSNQTGF